MLVKCQPFGLVFILGNFGNVDDFRIWWSGSQTGLIEYCCYYYLLFIIFTMVSISSCTFWLFLKKKPLATYKLPQSQSGWKRIDGLSISQIDSSYQTCNCIISCLFCVGLGSMNSYGFESGGPYELNCGVSSFFVFRLQVLSFACIFVAELLFLHTGKKRRYSVSNSRS